MRGPRVARSRSRSIAISARRSRGPRARNGRRETDRPETVKVALLIVNSSEISFKILGLYGRNAHAPTPPLGFYALWTMRTCRLLSGRAPLVHSLTSPLVREPKPEPRTRTPRPMVTVVTMVPYYVALCILLALVRREIGRVIAVRTTHGPIWAVCGAPPPNRATRGGHT